MSGSCFYLPSEFEISCAEYGFRGENSTCGPPAVLAPTVLPVLILSMLEEPRLIVVVLYQDRTAINHNGLPGAESFLHQEQIGLRDLGSFADSANWETVAHALIETFPLRCTHGLPEVRANDA